MQINDARVFIGPVMQIANTLAIFLCLRPKRGLLFSIGATLAYALLVHGVIQLIVRFFGPPGIFAGSFIGMLFLPFDIWLFRGRAFQKVFAFFIIFQFNGLLAAVAEMIIGVTVGFQNAGAQGTLLALSLALLALEMLALGFLGRRFFTRIFVDGEHLNWGIYSIGAVFSSVLVSLLKWQTLGAALYAGLMLFVLLGIAILCYTIVNTHEKAAKERLSQTLRLQMDAMREQTKAEHTHRAEMRILRHDMRHEAGVIMELFRMGNSREAEAVYSRWQDSLAETADATQEPELMHAGIQT